MLGVINNSSFRPSNGSLSKSTIINTIIEKRGASQEKQKYTGFYTDRSNIDNNFGICDEWICDPLSSGGQNRTNLTNKTDNTKQKRIE